MWGFFIFVAHTIGMRNVRLFIATSLDGYIARKDHTIDWLFTEGDYGYQQFLDSIDTTLMGNTTYRVVREMDMPFPYVGKQNYVFTNHKVTDTDDYVTFVDTDIAAFVRRLKDQPGKDIWLIGGGQINTILLNAGLIDELMVFIHPIILGGGIPLFGGTPHERKFMYHSSRAFEDGLLEVVYKRIPA